MLGHHLRAGRRWPDHQHEFAARLQRVGGLGQFGNLGAPDLLVHLCHLAADRSIAFAHDQREIGQRVLHPVAGFEHHKRGVDPRKFCQPRARALCLCGKNPSKKNRSVGNAATASADSTEEGPGSAITAKPAAQTSRTSLKPGSEIKGVPASDTSAIEAPCASFSRIFGRASAALCS